MSCLTPSLYCFSSDSDICPRWGLDPCFSAPTCRGQVQSYQHSCVSPSSSSCRVVWFYIFFSTGRVLLSTLSWCSACTSVSEGVFLMYPWREMYSMSTYSSVILFASWIFFLEDPENKRPPNSHFSVLSTIKIICASLAVFLCI